MYCISIENRLIQKTASQVHVEGRRKETLLEEQRFFLNLNKKLKTERKRRRELPRVWTWTLGKLPSDGGASSPRTERADRARTRGGPGPCRRSDVTDTHSISDLLSCPRILPPTPSPGIWRRPRCQHGAGQLLSPSKRDRTGGVTRDSLPYTRSQPYEHRDAIHPR